MYDNLDTVLDTLIETDAYKVSHVTMGEPGIETVFSNLTARGTRVDYITEGTVFFGLQALMYKLNAKWNEFFALNDDQLNQVLAGYRQFVARLMGTTSGQVSDEHFRVLHSIGHLPLRIRAFKEGSVVPLRVPYFTIENTDPRVPWLTNYLETTLSANLWQPTTSATLSWAARRMLDAGANASASVPEAVDFQGHDFSYRGMENDAAAAASGAGHLLSFNGTDTLPAIRFVDRFYSEQGADNGIIGMSVPASEHSIMTAAGRVGEFDVFERLIDQHTTGIVSLVADSYDFWNALQVFMPRLKDKIMARDGKVVLRPDCYDDETSVLTPRGWVLFRDLDPADKVAQVHPDNTYTFVTPLKTTRMGYDGYMVRFTDFHGKCNLLVTPNHRMLWKRRKGGDRVVEAGASYVGSCESKMYRSAAAADRGRKLTPIERFKIAFQADGSYPSKTVKAPVSGTRTYRFNFAKSRKLDRLVGICEDGGFEYSVHHEKARTGQSTVYVKLPDAEQVYKDFRWVDTSDLCGNWCREFVDELSYWDATRRHAARFKFDTAVPVVADVVELVAVSAGYGVTRTTSEDVRKEHFSDIHCLHIMKDNMLGGQAISKEYQWYTGEIHCVTVPTGMLLVKRGRGTAVCGNSGVPELILCGDPNAPEGSPERKGAVRILDEVFGSTVNDKGFKELDPHIGLIYGDGITYARAKSIIDNLMSQGYASTTVVFGFGSFTFQYQSRDTFMMAVKATWVQVDGVGRDIFKDPATDNGDKKSAAGRLAVRRQMNGKPYLIEKATPEQEADQALELVFENGVFKRHQNFADVRATLKLETEIMNRYLGEV